jgi:hypothetical protein
MLAACATLIFVLALAVPHATAARRLARFFRAQEKWAEMMDRHEEGNSDGSLGRTCEASLWCARVAICQHHLECMAGSME